MSDRFDEMAREMGRTFPGGLTHDESSLIAQALRSTDAKAREKERERWKQAILGVHMDHDGHEVAAALSDVLGRTAIREGDPEGEEVDNAE